MRGGQRRWSPEGGWARGRGRRLPSTWGWGVVGVRHLDAPSPTTHSPGRLYRRGAIPRPRRWTRAAVASRASRHDNAWFCRRLPWLPMPPRRHPTPSSTPTDMRPAVVATPAPLHPGVGSVFRLHITSLHAVNRSASSSLCCPRPRPLPRKSRWRHPVCHCSVDTAVPYRCYNLFTSKIHPLTIGIPWNRNHNGQQQITILWFFTSPMSLVPAYTYSRESG